MKQAIKMTAVYIGLVIGAGFASGREILEYFNFPSNTSFGGIIIAAFLFMAIAYIILSKSSEENLCDFDSYISSVCKKAAPAVKTFMLLYMFCGLFVMYAGSGALIYDTTSYSRLVGACLMALVCFIVLSFDLKGIVTLNLILVPLMIAGIIFVCVCSSVFKAEATFSSFGKPAAITLSAVCYASYNTVTAGAVLVPLASNKDTKTIRVAAVGGGFVIGLLIMLVWSVQAASFEILHESELPMLTLAAICGKMSKRIYTAVLFMAICTTAVSYGFGLMSHFGLGIKTRRQRTLLAAVICIAALPPAMYGFSNLVANLYSAFGYAGMAWILWIVIDRYS